MPTLPKLPFDLPSISLPSIELPTCTRPDLPSVDDVAAAARDAAYIGVGFAVMTAERVTDAVTSLSRQVSDLVNSGIEQARSAVTN